MPLNNVAIFPVPVPPHPVTAQVMGDLEGAIEDVREAIADADTVLEAYRIYLHIRAMAAQLIKLQDDAADRCNVLLDQL